MELLNRKEARLFLSVLISSHLVSVPMASSSVPVVPAVPVIPVIPVPKPWELDGLLTPSNFQTPPRVEIPFQWHHDMRLDDLRHIGEPVSFRIDPITRKPIFQVNRELVPLEPWSIEYYLYALDDPWPCHGTPQGERTPVRPSYHNDYIKRFVSERLAAGLAPTDGEGWRAALTALEPTARVDLAPGSSAPERLALEAEHAAIEAQYAARTLRSLDACSAKAPLFARIPREDMAWYLADGPHPEAWRRVTARVDPETLKYVEMRAEDIRAEEAAHASVAYIHEDGEIDEDSLWEKFIRRRTAWRSRH